MVNLTSAARMLFVVGLNAVSILSSVAEGKLWAFVIEGQELKLGSLRFKRSDIEQYIYKIKLDNNWVSREELTKLLKVKDVTLTRWVRKGLILPATVIGSTQYFSRDTVEKFIEDCITTDRAAELLRVDKLTVQKWAHLGRLSGACIDGPSIDGHHAYLFNRASLIQWRKERLPFGEAVRMLGVSKATLHRWVKEGKVEPLDDMGGKQRWFSQEIICRILEPLKANDNKQFYTAY